MADAVEISPDQIEKELQRRSGTCFRLFTRLANPRFTFFKHCELLADVLENVANGEIKRLLISLPPRHSKSEMISRLFTAYYLRKNPHHFVGINSYSAELAYTLSRAARENFIRCGGTVKDDVSAVKHWETPEGGGMWAAGVGGSITGKGFHLGLIDDPIKNAEEAASDTIREKQKEWYSSTFYTRGEPDAAIIVIQCMVGETPVLMSDGTEKPLKNIQVGDAVATYDKGRLSTSKVLNWKNQGSDYIFAIRMKSGIIVKANERHPFLVCKDGVTEWKKLKDLQPGDEIIRAMRKKERIEESSALPPDVINPQNAKDIVIPTTIKPGGQADIARRRLIPHQDAQRICATDTASALTNITQYSTNSAENAPSVASIRLRKTPALTGKENFALTTATAQEKLEVSYVTTAILQSATVKPKKPCSKPLNTYELTLDSIIEITPAGYEDVFDITVERTENFIANGLVSHNTRWHEDDLTGWLLSEESGEEPEKWHIVCLPAVYEKPQVFPDCCTVAPDFRTADGEALCPERYPEPKLKKLAARIGDYHFDALFQQRPTSKKGLFFDVAKLIIVEAAPVEAKRARGWDKAATAGDGDFTEGLRMAKAADGIHYIEDNVGGQWNTADRDKTIRQTAELDGQKVRQIGEQEPGGSGVSDAENFIRMLSGFPVSVEKVSTNKMLRADAFSAQVNAGNVKLVKGEWNKGYIEQLRKFPKGKHDDKVDASSLAFNNLNNHQDWGVGRRNTR